MEDVKWAQETEFVRRGAKLGTPHKKITKYKLSGTYNGQEVVTKWWPTRRKALTEAKKITKGIDSNG